MAVFILFYFFDSIFGVIWGWGLEVPPPLAAEPLVATLTAFARLGIRRERRLARAGKADRREGGGRAG